VLLAAIGVYVLHGWAAGALGGVSPEEAERLWLVARAEIATVPTLAVLAAWAPLTAACLLGLAPPPYASRFEGRVPAAMVLLGAVSVGVGALDHFTHTLELNLLLSGFEDPSERARAREYLRDLRSLAVTLVPTGVLLIGLGGLAHASVAKEARGADRGPTVHELREP